MSRVCIVCRMKTFRLTLSDSASNRAIGLASGHGVPVESYLSSEMEDVLDNKPHPPHKDTQSTEAPSAGTLPAPSFSTTMPDTLHQVLEVCKCVYRNGDVPREERHAKAEFLDAISTVAKNVVNSETGLKGVEVTTVRDKCTTDRRLGLPGVHIDTPTFLAWLCRPELLRDHLCRKFPKFVGEIRKRFAEWLPNRL